MTANPTPLLRREAQNQPLRVCKCILLLLVSRAGHALVYEHYRPDWSWPDWEYNKEEPDDTFRPWGFQPGHLVEWAKLLVQLQRYTHVPSEHSAAGDPAAPALCSGSSNASARAAAVGEPEHEQAWRIPTAQRFFDAAVKGWDEAHGGFVYSLAPQPDLPQSNTRKYYWVQAEAIAATALLATAVPLGSRGGASDGVIPGNSNDGSVARDRAFYMGWYDRIWRYSWRHFIDHVHGGWYRILTPANAKVDVQKSPPGKVEYHACGACYEAARALQDMASR
jgi:mannose/cellobiose epimerase-like protein (N-acyl-D-glucosamine 2-epimerase family)